MQWLNTKGHREVALKQAFTKWWPHITAGLKKRGAVSGEAPKVYWIGY